ncbi:(2Fe-2S)-binding protein [Teredinibacter sp. KSP-S5-2]|uniref:(2Fe-2S)-binding protein n=1 Tax=Teredinibacter sp. KSP-S5-2 TaxID=3034506 RepID=UPI0029343FDF|nr:2Fe-2S iron-sulfur cluster-binding protein [Teredinibacter sp. KSP-S5-2]WNO10780.1 (2Fe-2S)-binding protein [Teredinibacter sp. KSP-S5-2]
MVTFTLNGETVTIDNEDMSKPLLWFLRDQQQLTGTKYGCGKGLCGACTVHVNGYATPSCSLPLGAVNGMNVTTIEGLEKTQFNTLQQAWIEQDVPQCGYCQPGQIMSAADLLAHNKNPSEEDITQKMTNICRCGTYSRIRKAIKQAAHMTNLAAEVKS